MFNNLYAHVDQENRNKKQKLIEHLVNTAEESEKIGKKINLANASYLVGLLHDIGKFSKEFQEKLFTNSKNHVDHSTFGGYIILKLSSHILNEYEEKIGNMFRKNNVNIKDYCDYINILVYVILSHHGPYDLIRESKENKIVYASFDRIDKIDNENLESIYENIISEFYKNKIYIKEIFIKGFIEYVEIFKKLMEFSLDDENYKYEAIDFYKGLFVRTLVSILKSSDIKDTINSYDKIIYDYEEDELYKIKKEFENKVNEKYKSFGPPNTPINKVRNKIANDILLRSKIDNNGIYRLNLPTGAGKTLLSLRYGINQLKYQNKDRFFYVTSYLSVLEQNAKEIKDVLKNDKYILEHHSNVIDKEFDENDDIDDSFKSIIKDYLLDNWSSPVVMTTMVQFFNTIFKGKSSNITRFKSMINSVIIIDECQSIPSEYMYITNLSLNYLKIVFNANIVLSTATQPTNDEKTLKHRLAYGNMDSNFVDIIKLNQTDLDCFKRVDLKIFKDINKECSLEEIKELVLSNRDKSVLIILNTKRAVRDLYNILSSYYNEEDLYYLTTNLTAYDRIGKIDDIKDRLIANDKICLISTQLIEAGVDVDFDLVIRSISGVDSIVQAMGRCNREGKKEISETYVVNIDRNIENTSYLKGIDERKEAARYVLRKNRDNLVLEDIVQIYFKKLYANLNDKDFSNILSLLSYNRSARDEYVKSQKNLSCIVKNNIIYEFNKCMVLNMFQSFKEAYNKFDFIKEKQDTAVIDYDASKDILNRIRDLEIEFKNNYDLRILKEIKSLCKSLSIHSVNISKKDLDKATSILDGMLYVVDSVYYDSKFGIDFDRQNLFLM